jgi:glucoamylase
VALPVLLAAKLRAVGHLTFSNPEQDMVRRAIAFIVRRGPMTDQDRWEENAGISPFTLTVCICALVVSADYFGPVERSYILALADCWNERIEDWTYFKNGTLANGSDEGGYYVRLCPRPADGGPTGSINRRNVAHGLVRADDLIGLEFLYLVRTGLRDAHDKRITNTVALVDRLLRAETPNGPSYYRYNGDGYGEKPDGGPFDGTGVGRLWPLLTGERGHYAVMAGEDALPYVEAMSRMTGPGGLIPEQVWDVSAVPEYDLYPGQPTGSAMPLVWAHAEFLKLVAAVTTGQPIEIFAEVESRYSRAVPSASCWNWREGCAFELVPEGKDVLIEADAAFMLHVGDDTWRRTVDLPSSPTAFGLHGVRITAGQMRDYGTVRFTWRLTDQAVWRGKDFAVAVARPA